MRDAAEELEPLSRCGGADTGREPGASATGEDVLVAELFGWRDAKARRHAGAGLEAVAWRGAGAGVQRGEVLPVAMVLELWRRGNDGSLYALDRRGALGNEVRSAARRADAWGQIYFRAMGLSGHGTGGAALSGI